MRKTSRKVQMTDYGGAEYPVRKMASRKAVIALKAKPGPQKKP